MKCVCVKFVPRLLTNDQHEQRHKIASDLFEHSCEDMQFLKNIMTAYKSWCVRVRPGDKTAVVMTNKGAPGAKQNKGHVTGVF